MYGLLAFEFIPFLKNKKVALGRGVSKMVLRGFLSYNRLGNVDDYLKDISRTTKDVLDTKDFVIILDDLDRLSETLKPNELIGFVNSLVEHENNKVIIIADEQSIEDDLNYKVVREKTIGTIIEFTTSFDKTFDEIISDKYGATFNIYYQHLNSIKQEILSIFELTRSTNLRSLIYFLQHYSEIFHALYSEFQITKTENSNLTRHKFEVIVRFTLAISLEFKKSLVTYTKPAGIDDVVEINKMLHNNWLKETFADKNSNSNREANEENTKKLAYHEYFVNTYYVNKNYDFYKAIFDFVTGGNELDLSLLKQELKLNIDDKISIPRQQDIVHQKLSYPQVYDLSNESLKNLTEKMYEYALDGEYPLDRYLSVFHYLERFNSILKYDAREVANNLIDAVKKNKSKFSYDDNLEYNFGTSTENPNYELFREIFKVIMEVNSDVKVANYNSNVIDLFGMFKNEPEQFYKIANAAYSDKSIFDKWNFLKFYNHFSNLPATQIKEFTRFCKNRYQVFDSHNWIEIDFISDLINKLQYKEEGKEQTLRDYILQDLSKLLVEIFTNHQRGEDGKKKNRIVF